MSEEFKPYIPLDRHFADELLACARALGHDLRKGHANEFVARAHGFRTHAALCKDSLMSLDRYARDDFNFDVERARARAIELGSPVVDDFDAIAQCLTALHLEASNPDAALAARIARNACLNADWSAEINEFMGRTLLSPRDYDACVEVAMRGDFQDNLWANAWGVSTMAALARTGEILPQDDGYHAMVPDVPLNVAMHISPERVVELIKHYRVARQA